MVRAARRGARPRKPALTGEQCATDRTPSPPICQRRLRLVWRPAGAARPTLTEAMVLVLRVNHDGATPTRRAGVAIAATFSHCRIASRDPRPPSIVADHTRATVARHQFAGSAPRPPALGRGGNRTPWRVTTHAWQVAPPCHLTSPTMATNDVPRTQDTRLPPPWDFRHLLALLQAQSQGPRRLAKRKDLDHGFGIYRHMLYSPAAASILTVGFVKQPRSKGCRGLGAGGNLASMLPQTRRNAPPLNDGHSC